VYFSSRFDLSIRKIVMSSTTTDDKMGGGSPPSQLPRDEFKMPTKDEVVLRTDVMFLKEEFMWMGRFVLFLTVAGGVIGVVLLVHAHLHDHGSPLVHPDMSGRLIAIDRRIHELAGVVNRLEERVVELESADDVEVDMEAYMQTVNLHEAILNVSRMAQTFQNNQERFAEMAKDADDHMDQLLADAQRLADDLAKEADEKDKDEQEDAEELRRRDQLVQDIQAHNNLMTKGRDQWKELHACLSKLLEIMIAMSVIFMLTEAMAFVLHWCGYVRPKTPIEKLTERLDRLERGLRNLGSPVKEEEESKRSKYHVRARLVSDEDDDDKDD
jgi:hypothetical protein